MSDKLTVVELTAQNFMKLKKVHIDTQGKSVVIIGGRNAQGKSSTLESLVFALGSKRDAVADVVRHGAKQAAVQVLLGKDGETEYTVTKKRNPDRFELEQRGVDEPLKEPRKTLDEMIGDLTFDALALLGKAGKEQVEAVKRILGLDFTALEEEADKLFSQRHDDKIALKALQAQMDAIDVPKDAPTEEVNVNALISELETLEKAQSAFDVVEREVRDAAKCLMTINEEIYATQQKLTQLEEKREETTASQGDWIRKGLRIDTPLPEEKQAIRERISQAQETNRHVADVARLVKLDDQGGVLSKAITLTTNRLQEIDDEKVRAISETDIPVEGLTFDETGLFLNGVPLEQASQKEQIDVGFGLAIADNPRIGITLVRNASLLDDESKAHIAKIAEENGVQVWLEIVGRDPVAFVLEDGEVAREPIPVEDRCPSCHGWGVVKKYVHDGETGEGAPIFDEMEDTCPDCDGSGRKKEDGEVVQEPEAA